MFLVYLLGYLISVSLLTTLASIINQMLEYLQGFFQREHFSLPRLTNTGYLGIMERADWRRHDNYSEEP